MRSRVFSIMLVSVITVLLIVAGCAPAAPAATAPADKPADKPAPTTPAAPSNPPAAPPASTPAASPTPAAPAAPAAKELSFKAATYTNDAEGFSVQYPADWAKDTDEFKYMVYGAKAATILPRMLVYVYPTSNQDELIKLADEGFKANSGSNIKREKMEEMQLGANKGLYTLTNWDYPGYNLDTYSFSVVHNGKYIVVATTTMSGIAKYETLSKEIFSTLTFK